jgi:hypothetical protein
MTEEVAQQEAQGKVVNRTGCERTFMLPAPDAPHVLGIMNLAGDGEVIAVQGPTGLVPLATLGEHGGVVVWSEGGKWHKLLPAAV